MTPSLNKYSRKITQDPMQPGSQAMLHAIGLNDDDLSKPQIGIASTGWEGNPCNMHLNGLAIGIKESIREHGLIGLVFHTIGVSDGISMGTDGMRYSLPSRDIIADSIETVVSAQWYDGLIAVVGCDKNMPGAMMAMSRLDRPSILVYGGTIAPGWYKKRKLDIVSAFEALGEKISGVIDEEEFNGIVQNACPGPGACGGMYTANTIASAIEAMGMSLPYNASIPATNAEKASEQKRVGSTIKYLIANDIKPSDILTKESFENAITMVIALGGSTNAVLHLMAIAHEAKIALSLDDFQRISDRTPFLADLKPSGKFVMEDLYHVGGTPAVMKLLLNEGLLHGDCLTVTGKSLAENVIPNPPLSEGQTVIHDFSHPIKSSGHLQILYGNLAPEGAVAKITGKEGLRFTGPARVFNSEQEANDAIVNSRIQAGEVVVIRYCGPKGAPGMPEMLKPTSLIMGAGLGDKIALITDGRFSGGTHGFVVGHITPEAQNGGYLAIVENGDRILIDAENHLIELQIPEDEINKRVSSWKAPMLKTKNGALLKYAKTVSSASRGCITDDF